jgi:ketosteroid isomerase-like protein
VTEAASPGLAPPEPVTLFYEVFDFRRFAAGDFDELFGRYAAPDMELRLPREYPDLEDRKGVQAVSALFRQFEETWDEWRQEPEAWAQQGDTVLVFTSLVARGKGSGAEIATPAAHVWELSGDEVSSVAVHLDRDAALASAGFTPADLRPWS